jgi:hypothetical protein
MSKIYSSFGSQLFIDDRRIEQVRSIVVDWSCNRVRVRGFWPGRKPPGQQALEGLKEGMLVRLRLLPNDGDPIEWHAMVRFSRMRLLVCAAITFTAEFDISLSPSLVSEDAAASS